MTVINHPEKSPHQEVSFEEKTMVLTSAEEKILGPRLVCTTPSGESEIYPLNTPKLVIGRSIESDLNLLDPLVSRKHCVIEKCDDGFVVRNVSTTNPLFLNDQPIVEKRICSGDQIKIGSVSLAFISDRPEDARQADTGFITQNKRSGGILWLSVFLLFVFAGYYGYSNAYTPWKVKWTLESVSRQIESEKYLAAQKTLMRLMSLNLSPETEHQVMELMAQSALAITQQKILNEDLDAAMDYLTTFLADFGAYRESEILWDRLDYYRLTLGQRLETDTKYQQALQQYAAIREDSIYFEEAQKGMRRIWLAHQQQSRQDQTMAQLLKEADAHFRAQRYLKPVNQNAYAVYQAVLALDPEHELALERIDQMKAFYHENGEKNFADMNWSKALSYFERYYLMDTENHDLNDKIRICREKLTEARLLARESSNAKEASGKKQKSKNGRRQDEKREEIKRLLEEAGTESSWIMKYLFEDQNDNQDSEKPW
jgi:hypothetical protein